LIIEGKSGRYPSKARHGAEIDFNVSKLARYVGETMGIKFSVGGLRTAILRVLSDDSDILKEERTFVAIKAAAGNTATEIRDLLLQESFTCTSRTADKIAREMKSIECETKTEENYVSKAKMQAGRTLIANLQTQRNRSSKSQDLSALEEMNQTSAAGGINQPFVPLMQQGPPLLQESSSSSSSSSTAATTVVGNKRTMVSSTRGKRPSKKSKTSSSALYHALAAAIRNHSPQFTIPLEG